MNLKILSNGYERHAALLQKKVNARIPAKWGEGMKWINRYDGGPHEANFLKLDCSKVKSVFGWKPVWNLDGAISATVEWSKCMRDGGDVGACMDKQISEFVAQSSWINK